MDQEETQVAQSEESEVGELNVSATDTAPHPIMFPTMLLVVIGLVVSFVTGIAYAYTQGYIQLPFLDNAPYSSEELMDGIATSIGTMESATYAGSMRVAVAPRDEGVFPFPKKLFEGNDLMEQSFMMYGMLGSVLPDDFDLTFGIEGIFDTSEDAAGGKAKITAALDMDDLSFNIDAETMWLGLDRFFVRVNRFPSMFFDISDIKGTWIGLTQEDIGIDGMYDALADMGDTTQDYFIDFYKEAFLLVQKHDILVVTGLPEKVELNGEEVYRYQIAYNGANMSAYYTDYLALIQEYIDDILDEDEQELFQELADYDQADMQDLFERMSTAAYVEYMNAHYPMFAWMRADGEIAQLGVEARLALDEESAPDFVEKQIEVTTLLYLSDINRPVTLSAPEGAITLEEAGERSQAIGNMLESQRVMKEYAEQASVYGFQSAASVYFAGHDKYPQTLQEYFVFETELYGYPAVEVGYENALYTPLDDGNAYILCTPVSDGKHFCGVSSGVTGEVNLSEVGGDTDSLADMAPTIIEGLQKGTFLSPTERDTKRSELLEEVGNDFYFYFADEATYAEGWKVYMEDEVYGTSYSQLPEYATINFAAGDDEDSFTLCIDLEEHDEPECVDGPPDFDMFSF